MGLDKILRDRKDRLQRPEMIQAHVEEWERVEKSFKTLKKQTKKTSVGIIVSGIRIFFPKQAHDKKGKKHEKGSESHAVDRLEHTVEKLADITGHSLVLLCRGIMTATRTAKHGVRKGLAI
jgi:hypothetical protein